MQTEPDLTSRRHSLEVINEDGKDSVVMINRWLMEALGSFSCSFGSVLKFRGISMRENSNGCINNTEPCLNPTTQVFRPSWGGGFVTRSVCLHGIIGLACGCEIIGTDFKTPSMGMVMYKWWQKCFLRLEK